MNCFRGYDKHKTPKAIKRFAAVLLSPGAIGRPIIAPPNTPADRLKLLREAYAKMLNDPDFLADAKKRDWDVEYISGQELDAMAKKAVVQPPETVGMLKKILEIVHSTVHLEFVPSHTLMSSEGDKPC